MKKEKKQDKQKDKDKTYFSERDIKWDKLDNTANLFPVIAGEDMTNVYRISVILKEEINRVNRDNPLYLHLENYM